MAEITMTSTFQNDNTDVFQQAGIMCVYQNRRIFVPYLSVAENIFY